MSRLLIHVEGQTEETFVNEVLAPHLCSKGFRIVSARLIGNARQRAHRGGIRAWGAVRKDIVNHLREDAGYVATTMVDYYGLPKTGGRAWPGRDRAGDLPFPRKAAAVQDALSEDVIGELGDDFDLRRFVPYVIMHEFEGLLFSDCDAFGRILGQGPLADDFQAIRDKFDTPEEINDSPVTAPSKCVESLVPGYQKPLMGVLAALEIGLDTIKDQCPQFREWLERLEACAAD